MNKLSIELDIAHEAESLASALVAITEDHPSLTYRVLTLQGPGGGWPYVRFEGNESDMRAFLLEYCAGDAEQAAEYALTAA